MDILNMVCTLRFFPFQNAVCFMILTYLVPVLFTFCIQDVLKLKKNNSGAKRLNKYWAAQVKITVICLGILRIILLIIGIPVQQNNVLENIFTWKYNEIHDQGANEVTRGGDVRKSTSRGPLCHSCVRKVLLGKTWPVNLMCGWPCIVIQCG